MARLARTGWRGFALMMIVGLAGLAGCQLAYPDTLSTECANAEAFCDDFERTSPLPPQSAWNAVVCDPGASLAVDGALTVRYPAHAAGAPRQCYLETSIHPTDGHVRVELDVTLGGSGPDTVVIANVIVGLAGANGDGLQNVLFETLVDGTGRVSLVTVYYYPDASRSPIPGNSFPSYLVGTTTEPWLVVGQRCHVRLDIESVAPTFTGTATCGGSPHIATPNSPVMPRGVASGARVELGYEEVLGIAMPDWSLQYDNFLFVTK